MTSSGVEDYAFKPVPMVVLIYLVAHLSSQCAAPLLLGAGVSEPEGNGGSNPPLMEVIKHLVL